MIMLMVTGVWWCSYFRILKKKKYDGANNDGHGDLNGHDEEEDDGVVTKPRLCVSVWCLNIEFRGHLIHPSVPMAETLMSMVKTMMQVVKMNKYKLVWFFLWFDRPPQKHWIILKYLWKFLTLNRKWWVTIGDQGSRCVIIGQYSGKMCTMMSNPPHSCTDTPNFLHDSKFLLSSLISPVWKCTTNLSHFHFLQAPKFLLSPGCCKCTANSFLAMCKPFSNHFPTICQPHNEGATNPPNHIIAHPTHHFFALPILAFHHFILSAHCPNSQPYSLSSPWPDIKCTQVISDCRH